MLFFSGKRIDGLGTEIKIYPRGSSALPDQYFLQVLVNTPCVEIVTEAYCSFATYFGLSRTEYPSCSSIMGKAQVGVKASAVEHVVSLARVSNITVTLLLHGP